MEDKKCLEPYQEFLKVKEKITEEVMREHNCFRAGCGQVCKVKSHEK